MPNIFGTRSVHKTKRFIENGEKKNVGQPGFKKKKKFMY